MNPYYEPSIDGPLHDMVVPSDLTAAKEPERVILAEIERCGYAEDTVFAIKLSLEEAMTNAVRHGNRHDSGKRVRVKYAVTPRRVVIMVGDDGPGFRPDDVPDPTLPENLERPNGRGIMLIRAYMTIVGYNERGNEVWMMKENESWKP